MFPILALRNSSISTRLDEFRVFPGILSILQSRILLPAPMPVMLRAQLSHKERLIGSFEGPLFENRQPFDLFPLGQTPEDPGWEEQMRLEIHVKPDQDS